MQTLSVVSHENSDRFTVDQSVLSPSCFGHTRLIVMYILNFDVLVFVLTHNIHTSAPAGVVAKQTFPLVCRMLPMDFLCHKF